MSKSREQESPRGASKVPRSASTGAFMAKNYNDPHPPKDTLTEKSTRDLIARGVELIDKSTQKQINDIDQMAIKYGL